MERKHAVRAAGFVVAIATIALAGCLGAVEPETRAGDALEPARLASLTLPTAYGYLCPGDAAAAPAPCTVAITGPEVWALEPYAAAHPEREGVFAVQTTRIAAPSDVAASEGAEARVIGQGLYVTEDGGITWREATLPAPPFENGDAANLVQGGDPVLLFEPDGRLHSITLWWPMEPEPVVVGLVLAGTPKTFATYSDDLGKTWSEPVLVDGEGGFEDRQWISRDPETGTLFLTWQHDSNDAVEDRLTQIAWSTDRGESWQRLERDEEPRCFRGGPHFVEAGRLVLACATMREGAMGLDVLAFDGETQEIETLSHLDREGQLPMLERAQDGRYVLTGDTCFWAASDCDYTSWIAGSDDGGRTWSEPVMAATLVEGDWPEGSRVFWASADPWGAIHLLVWTAREAETQPPSGEPLHEYAVHHVVLGPGLARMQSVEIDRWQDADDPAGWFVLRHRQAGDFFGMDWQGERAIVAYTARGELRATIVGIATESA